MSRRLALPPALAAARDGLFGRERRLESSTVALAGCVFGWFLPLAVPARAAPTLASLWWAWPVAFVALWLMTSRPGAGALGAQAGARATCSYLPAFLMLACPFLLDFRGARMAVLGLVIAGMGVAALLSRGAGMAAQKRCRSLLRACRIAAVAVLAAIWASDPNYPGILVAPGDGDHVLAWLNDGLHGKRVYAQFWYPYGPLFYALQVLAARTCGLDRFQVSSQMVTSALTALLLCLSARWLFLTWPFQLLGSIFIFLAWPWPPDSVGFRVHGGVFALIAITVAAGIGRLGALALAGAGAGVAFLYSHEVALAAIVSAQPAMLWASYRPGISAWLRAYARALGALLAGLGLVLVPMFMWGAAAGLLRPYLRSTFGFMAVVDACCGSPFPSLLRELPSPATPWLARLTRLPGMLLGSTFRHFYLPVLVYVLAGLYLLARALRGRRRLPQDAVILSLTILGLLLFRVALGRSEVNHAIFGTVPALVLTGVLLERIALRIARVLDGDSGQRALEPHRASSAGRHWVGSLRALELAMLAAAFVFLAVCARFPLANVSALGRALDKVAGYYRLEPRPTAPPALWGWKPVRARNGALYYFQESAAGMVQATFAYLEAHTKPGEGVFAFPYPFRYNVLLDRASPLDFGPCVWSAAARPADRMRLIQELAAKRPRYIVYDESEWPDMDGVASADRFPEVAAFIFERYGLEKQIGATSILRYRSSPEVSPPSVIRVDRAEDQPFLLSGWYYPQAMGDVVARWTTTSAAARLTRRPQHRELSVEALSYAPPGRPPRWMAVRVEDQEIGRVDLSAFGGWKTLRFELPAGGAKESSIVVRLDIDEPYPAADLRRLGIVVRSLAFQ